MIDHLEVWAGMAATVLLLSVGGAVVLEWARDREGREGRHMATTRQAVVQFRGTQIALVAVMLLLFGGLAAVAVLGI